MSDIGTTYLNTASWCALLPQPVFSPGVRQPRGAPCCHSQCSLQVSVNLVVRLAATASVLSRSPSTSWCALLPQPVFSPGVRQPRGAPCCHSQCSLQVSVNLVVRLAATASVLSRSPSTSSSLVVFRVATVSSRKVTDRSPAVKSTTRPCIISQIELINMDGVVSFPPSST